MAYSYVPVLTAYNGCYWSCATNAWVPYSPTLKKSRSNSLSSYSSYSEGSYSASYASSYSVSVRREGKPTSFSRRNVSPVKKTSRSSRGRSTSRMERCARSRSRGTREPERITRERSAESRCRVRRIRLTPAPRQRRLPRAVSTSRERSSKKCSSREQSPTCRSWADRFAADDAKKKSSQSWNGPEGTRYRWSSWTRCTSAKRRANKKRGGWRVQAKKAAWLQKTPQNDSTTPLPSVMILDSSLEAVVDEKRRLRARSISSDSSE